MNSIENLNDGRPFRAAKTFLPPLALAALAVLGAAGCNSTDPADDVPAVRALAGVWFMCEDFAGEPARNADCAVVNENGFRFGEDGSAHRVDGAEAFAKVVLGDTNPPNLFGIGADTLSMFRELPATFALSGDSLTLTLDEPAVGEAGTARYAFQLTGNILRLSGADGAQARYRKFLGKAGILSQSEWLASAAGWPKANLGRRIPGIWFLCADHPDGAEATRACDVVDDDGLEFSADGNLYSVDGAQGYARKAFGEAAVLGNDFRIDVDSLYMFRDDTASYVVEGDSIAFTVKGEDGNPATDRDAFNLSGDILTIRGANDPTGLRYRKYRGKARVVTQAEFQAAMAK